MALNKTQLENDIKTMIETSKELGDVSDADFARDLATVIHNYLSQLTITIPPGTIRVAGSPSAQANVAPITLSLSTLTDITG